MSEYWKSTPKYWCKHCRTYVRDTKLEKTNHEATPKHQGNLKRFLRDLHRGHERDERDKQRAKSEVERLNGVVSGEGSSSGALWRSKPTATIPVPAPAKQVSVEERKRQLAQLAEMGVAIPEEFRGEMAMAGDWRTTSRSTIEFGMKKEGDEDDTKPGSHSIGVRKRKYEGQEEEEEAGETIAKRGWGSTTRTYPGSAQVDDDLDALLKVGPAYRKGKGRDASDQPVEGGQREGSATRGDIQNPVDESLHKYSPQIKREDSDGAANTVPPTINDTNRIDASVKEEEDAPGVGIIFKKRKARCIRQR
ncbi:MAG: hypothetical protein M1827_003222 [Pycnora praestabilis]|nr:MAG: hypothetical protein M1827_003222 [Pycnora praestabilis]